MSAAIISFEEHRLDQVLPHGAASSEAKAALQALGAALKQHAYAFTAVTPLTQRRVNARLDAALAHDLPGIFGWNRPFKAAVPGPDLFALMLRAGVVPDGQDTPRATLRAATLGGQLYFHSSFPTTTTDTYRFVRAMRASLLTQSRPVRRAVDIGCGAGPGAVTIALAYPGAQVFAADINPAALVLAEVNAAIALASNVTPVNSNLLNHITGEFDLIVSNPPYLLDPDQRAYRHGGGDLGAGLSIAIVEQAIERLAPGGTLMLYTGVAIVASADPFRMAVEPLLQAAGFHWSYEEIDPDVFGEELEEIAYSACERIAAVWLCATKPGSPA